MFGEELSHDTGAKLFKDLSLCQAPFQVYYDNSRDRIIIGRATHN